MPYTQETVNIKAIFQSLVEALELSDPYTRGHSDRVSMLAVALGLDLGLSSRELEILKDAGVLHDIGKIGISKDVLNKPGRLSGEEFELIKQHVTFGYNILKPLDIPELLEITLLHHERIDGRGYPDGRTDYPLLVKVLQIADVWDALTSDRPYRGAMPITKARDLMGTADNNFGFEPSLLETFLRLTRFIFPDDDCQPDEMEQILSEFEDLGVLEDLTPIK
jgi:HD-GYP domain-containing protein (c-di-GMP phosphodiesterase class II)